MKSVDSWDNPRQPCIVSRIAKFIKNRIINIALIFLSIKYCKEDPKQDWMDFMFYMFEEVSLVNINSSIPVNIRVSIVEVLARSSFMRCRCASW